MNILDEIIIQAKARVFGDGQRIMDIHVKYPKKWMPLQAEPTDFRITDRNIESIEKVSDGLWLHLTEGGSDTLTHYHEGKGPGALLKIRDLEVEVQQVQDLICEGDKVIEAWPDAILTANVREEIVDDFQLKTYKDTLTGETLTYNLFLPKDYDKTHKYPLVLFMHDMGTTSNNPKVSLIQGLGGVSFANDLWQKDHPCIVLAPQYTRKVVNDAHETEWETEATIRLIDMLSHEYGVDRKRIYGTGQSMGCMMLCEMNAKHPGFFAASLMVAGQWEPEVMATAAKNNLFIIVSEGDKRAYPGMIACVAVMEREGAVVVRGGIDAKAPSKELRKQIEALTMKEHNIIFSWFTGSSVIPDGFEDHPGNHHMKTWVKAYDVRAFKDWMFSKSN